MTDTLKIDQRHRAYMPFADHDTYQFTKDDRGVITLTPVALVNRPLHDLTDTEAQEWLEANPEVVRIIEASMSGKAAPITTRPPRP